MLILRCRTTCPATLSAYVRCWCKNVSCMKIESACECLSDAQRYAARQAQALPLLRSLETWLAQESPRLLPKSPSGKAAIYTGNQWQALVRYTEDGELSIDNSVSERTVKMQAIGRNYVNSGIMLSVAWFHRKLRGTLAGLVHIIIDHPRIA